MQRCFKEKSKKESKMAFYLSEFFHRVKRLLFNKVYLAVLLTMIILTLFCVHIGVIEHQEIISNSKDFKQCEKIVFDRIPNYDKYSDYGFRVYFIPAASSVFFTNPEILSDLNARVNSIVTMNIYNNTKTKSLFKRKFPMPLRYSIVLLLLGGVFCLVFGHGALRQKEYLRSLCSTSSHVKIYSLQILPRFLVIILSLVLISGINLCFALLKNIEFTKHDMTRLSAHLLTALLTLGFFFSLGVIAGFFTRGNWNRRILLGAVFVLFILLLPLLIFSIIEGKSEKLTSPYKIETQKLEVLGKFEINTFNKYGKFNKDDIETERKIVKGFLEKEHKQIMGFERQLRDEILELIQEQETLCMLTPVTFYLSTGEEVSSRGYRGFINMYDYVIVSHDRFLGFWIQRVYYHDPKIMVNFVKANENIFKSTGCLPGNYWSGVLVNTVYIFLLLLGSFLLFKQSMYRMKTKELKSIEPSQMNKISLKISRGEFREYKTDFDIPKDTLYLTLSGKIHQINRAGFSGEIIINGVNIAGEKFKEDFFYICRPEDLPEELTVKECITTCAKLLKLTNSETKAVLESAEISPVSRKVIGKLSQAGKFEVLIGLMRIKTDRVYLVNDIDKDLAPIYSIQLKDRIDELTSQGASIILLTSYVMSKDVRRDIFFEKSNLWTYMVEENKKLIELRQQMEKEQGENS
jgi:ABC-type multidrug transport system ATPase subunit